MNDIYPKLKISQIKKRHSELCRSIFYHNYCYFELQEPVISDDHYDLIYKDLEELEKMHADILDITVSPTQSVGFPVSKSIFVTREHDIPMLSLKKNYLKEEVLEFIAKHSTEIIIEPKYDGIAISLVYKSGRLMSSLTRGNGFLGEEILHNVKKIPSIPKHIEDVGLTHVRGELCVSSAAFSKYKPQAGKVYSNSRNFSSGIIRSIHPALDALSIIEFIPYAAYGTTNEVISKDLELLHQLGFSQSPHCVSRDSKDILAFHEAVSKDMRFPCDGTVLKVNNKSQHNLLGSSSTYNRGELAFKFNVPSVTAEITDVVYGMSRRGILTPVAQITPINLQGVVITRATMHNLDFMRDNALGKGAIVAVSRAGSVIPKIVKTIKGVQEALPLNCPYCGSRLIKGSTLQCVSDSCNEKKLCKLIHLVSKHVLDIKGCSESVVRAMYAQGLCDNILDIYKIKHVDLEMLEGFKERKINNLLSSINNSKGALKKPWVIWMLMDIEGVGLHMAKKLCKHIDLSHAIAEGIDKESLLNINGVGDVVAKAITDYFKEQEHLAFLSCVMEGDFC